ncbi:MAG: NAD(P)/FAD-dependent oxidoreductase [Gammaproteobacteria bacterium]|nr:MAG: NAD(P)/FAD-dependent oxidoreductase [Gammaproteobacteria bacterium]
MSTSRETFDVVVIGAGPSGVVASALLNKNFHRVLVVEKQYFPRFSIGESLLPQCMTFLEQANMLSAVEAAGFQYKNGAAFARGEETAHFDFNEKLTNGWGSTYQVERGRFDKTLADEAVRQGVTIRYGHSLTGFDSRENIVFLKVQDECGQCYRISAKFVLDASGFGRVLAGLLDLEKPSRFAARTSIFTHIKDNISDHLFDRNKILITVHPKIHDVWYWLIPFRDGRASVGVIAPDNLLAEMQGDSKDQLKSLIAQGGRLSQLLNNSDFDTRIGTIQGYSADVKQLFGNGFALLGNAGEFLDPVFSSGVTIALKSASLAADVLDRQLRGLNVDWNQEFTQPLMQGVNTFRHFVEAWYDGRLQDIIFATDKNESVKRMICSILAGYAWDGDNPFVKDSSRIDTLAKLCRAR